MQQYVFFVSRQGRHMKHTNELADSLNVYFKWNKARIKCFINMVFALFAVKTVNLVELSCAFEGSAKQSSRYKRLQRFFRNFNLDFDLIAGFVFNSFFSQSGKWYLTIDRTHWQLGKSVINIFMLAIVYQGVAIPIYWTIFRKKGNSDTQERIALLEKFTKLFGKDKVAGLLGDREFIGGAWFKYLIKEKIPFYIRIKNNAITTNSRGKEVDIRLLFLDLKPGEHRVLFDKRKLWGNELYLAAILLSREDDLLIVATNEETESAIKIYSLRWKIETLFASLKTRGFRLEETHVVDLERLKKILALLTVAFCWAFKVGLWRIENREEIKLKKHGRKEKSIFRHGLDWIRKEIWGSKVQLVKLLKVVINKLLLKPIPFKMVTNDILLEKSVQQ